MTTQAPAKVNLCLLVGPARDDGYHELFSVFVPVDLCDELTFTLSLGGPAEESSARSGSAPVEEFGAQPSGRTNTRAGAKPSSLSVLCPALDEGGFCDGEANLVTKALLELGTVVDRTIEGQVRIRKAIPIGAGLGGGSSDAAAALKVGARLLAEEGDISLDQAALHSIARRLGADVPFFLGDGPALGRGIGDVLKPLSLPPIPLVLLLPDEILSTARVYATFDALTRTEGREAFSDRALRAEEEWCSLARGARHQEREIEDQARVAERIAGLLENDLEQASLTLLPELAERRQALLDAGALGALMSGSGPTLFGVCRSREGAEVCAGELEARGYAVRCAVTGVSA